MDNCPHTDAGACSFCYSSLLAKVKLQSTEHGVMVEALEQLARLGSGAVYGNSTGNMIARRTLRRVSGRQSDG